MVNGTEEIKQPSPVEVSPVKNPPDEKVVIGKTFVGSIYNEKDRMYRYASGKKLVEYVVKHYLPIFEARILQIKDAPKTFELERWASRASNLEFVIDNISIHNEHKANIRVTILFFIEGSGFHTLCSAKIIESGNCCGSMLLYDMKVDYMNRSGIGTILLNMMEDIARVQKSSNLIALNPTELSFTKFLQKNEWIDICNFRNDNSTNQVSILSKSLPKQFVQKEILLKKINKT